MAVMLAKIKAQLRRGYEMQEERNVLKDDDLLVDIERRSVTLKGKPLALSVKEFELLVLLLRKKHTTLRKDYIFSAIWTDTSESELSTLTTHVNTLREKIETDPRHPKRLITVWGVGYRYEGIE